MHIAYKPYRYVKAVPGVSATDPQATVFGRLCAVIFIASGFGLLTWVFIPLFSWQFTPAKSRELVSPLLQNNQVLGRALDLEDGKRQFRGQKVTLRKLADGFSYFKPTQAARETSLTEFTLSIPKLAIREARTVVASEDFEKSLAHLSGTALPGEVGNVFVTGHSALPVFFSQANYKTIFAHLPKLDIFDEVGITAARETYTYRVEKRSVVDPTDVSVIDPPDPFGKYLTLMTCVPPGLNTKRLIVLARLVE